MAPFRFPAGTSLSGEMVGGRFASMSQARAAQIVGPTRVTYTSRFPSIIAGIQIRCHASAHESAERILEDAQDRVPQPGQSVSGRATGALRDSLHLVALDITEDWAVVSDLEYAPYVEFGTVNMPAQPYIIPAVEAERPEFIARTAGSLARL